MRTRKQIQQIIDSVEFLDRKFIILDKGDGFLLQLSYEEENVETGKMEVQKSRKYYISPYMTETEIVETAFLCVSRSMAHIVKEHFRYEGMAIMNPHFTVDSRAYVLRHFLLDRRDPV